MYFWEFGYDRAVRWAREHRPDAPAVVGAVINWWLDQLAEQGTTYQTVRCAFSEGQPVFHGMEIMRESHVQVAVRDPACILGVFRPYDLGTEEEEDGALSPP